MASVRASLQSCCNGRATRRGRSRCCDYTHYEHRRGEFLKDAIAWHGAHRLVYREDVAEGMESAPAHLMKAMRGENFGHPLIRL
jgi:NADPH-dependent curcumin reductase CurA